MKENEGTFEKVDESYCPKVNAFGKERKARATTGMWKKRREQLSSSRLTRRRRRRARRKRVRWTRVSQRRARMKERGKRGFSAFHLSLN